MTVRIGVVEVLEVVEVVEVLEPEGGLGALRTERGNLPLELIEVRSSVAGLAVRTELAQGFRNPYDVPLEATYIFPLPDRAAVTRLRMEAADRVIEGVVKEREAARADYDAAISEGKRASIAEEERPGVFTLRVGNIMPGEQVVVRTTLSGRLPYEDGQATFRFPLVVAPRYIPGAALGGEQVGSGTAADTDQVPDASRISPPVLLPGFPNPVRLSVEVAVDPAGLPLDGLTSSLHGVSVEEADSGRYLVRLDPGARADRDFVLRLGYGGAVAATSLAVAWDDFNTVADTDSTSAEVWDTDSLPDSGTFLLTVLPPEPTGTTRPRDVALVLDRSGSMAGWKMTAARRAAARIVDTLTAADRFAVLTFDHEVTTPADLPADALAAATDRHRFRAVQHLASVEARGGTEMMEPLKRAATLLAGDAADGSDASDASDRDRVLILVTDGEIGNEDALLSALANRLPGLRVHTVGVDSAVNAGFLNRLSTLGGGHCELVESEDRLDEAMAGIHRRIGTPLVTDLRLAGFGGLEPDQDSITPTRLPDLFAGAPLVVAGRFSQGAPTDSPGITVAGTASDGSAWHQRVVAAEIADAGLPQFWARGRIRDLEDRYVSTSGLHPELEREIVETSVGHSVLSRFTAFVAIDTRVVNKSGAVKQVTQPVDLPDGWAMLEEADDLDMACPVAMPAAPPTLGAAPAVSRGAIQPSMKVAKRSRHTITLAGRAAPHATPAAPTGGPGYGGAIPAAPGAAMPQPPMPPMDSPAMEPEEFSPTAPTPLTADELHTFATAWLPRLSAAANDTEEAQNSLLTELMAALTDMLSRVPAHHSTALATIRRTLSETDRPAAERRDAATAFMESLLKTPRRRPFWKR